MNGAAALLLVLAGLAVLDGEWGEAGGLVAFALAVGRFGHGGPPRRVRFPGGAWRR